MILSGGDPLVLSARRLAEIMHALGAISHVRVIRVHTRLPVVAPGRVNQALVRALNSAGKATYVVLHANHARELTPNARAACARFVDAGIPMLSQTVLLKGINDHAHTLGKLMRVLVESRIKPYYLHHADLAPGTAHWRTGIGTARSSCENYVDIYRASVSRRMCWTFPVVTASHRSARATSHPAASSTEPCATKSKTTKESVTSIRHRLTARSHKTQRHQVSQVLRRVKL